MCRNNNTCCSAYLGQLLYAHYIGERVTALSAVLLRYRDAHEAELLHLLHVLNREFLCLIYFLSERLYLVLSELSEQGARHFMFLV